MVRLVALSLFGAALAVGAVPQVAAAAPVAGRLGVPAPLQSDGKQFSLACSASPDANYTKQEYLPAGQAPRSYRQMLLVERLTGDLKPLDAARAQVRMLDQRKASDPLVNMDLIQNQASGEALLDFIVSSRDAAGNIIVEWNAYRYAPAPGGKPGVLLFGISHRSYGATEAKTFLGRLKALRPEQIKTLTATPLPKPR